MQIDIFVASVAYWVIIGGFLMILNRRISRVNHKIEDVEKRLKKEQQ